MDSHDNELDDILNRRAAPPAPAPGWEWHVADAAFAAHPRLGKSHGARGKGFWALLRDELGGLVILPRPAYALAACLAIGIITGVAAEPVLAMMQQQDLGIYIEMEDDAI